MDRYMGLWINPVFVLEPIEKIRRPDLIALGFVFVTAGIVLSSVVADLLRSGTRRAGAVSGESPC